MRIRGFYYKYKLFELIFMTLNYFIINISCLVEKIDSKTLSGTNAYIWLIKSPIILSQNINDPVRYSYGLMPDSRIKIELEFEYWNYFNNKDIFVSKTISGIEKRIHKEFNNLEKSQHKKEKSNNKLEKSNILSSGVPLLRFEDLPVSCILVFRVDEIAKLVVNIELVNSNELLYFGLKLKKLNFQSAFSRFVRYIILHWKSIINHLMPKIVTKSIEKRCFESLNNIVAPNLNVVSDNEENGANQSKKLNFYSNRTNDAYTSINKDQKNAFIEKKVYIEPLRNKASNGASGKTIKNVFLLLLNSEQLAALNHSPIQDLTLMSISNNYSAHFNVNSYIRSMVRIPIQDKKLNFEYKVPYLDRYSLLVVNGDRVPLTIKGKITINNPEPLNHLSFERRMDKYIIKFMFTLYIITIIGYIFIIINDQDGNLKITSLQLMTLVLLILKPICLYLDNNNLELFIQYGQIKFSNWFIPRAISRIHETIFIIYLLLISLGWKVLRDNLLSVETRLIFGLFVILFYIGLFEVLFGIFQIARYIFNAVVSLCIVVATNINATLIQNTISDNSISPRLGILYKKWQSYSMFKWIFAFFIVKPTFLFFWRVFTLQPNGYDDWVYNFIDQIIDFSIIVSVAVIFRPFKIPKLFTQLYPKSQFESNNENNNDDSNINNNTSNYIDNVNVSMWPVII
ncbi:hypothetical protein RS030_142212 [Cryptosporidium xiaoi]|uniref:Uncharacterized protein n=1 Tax=Cryptosporidium xiaoi TaxID=659607 RepID=A0AAV9Y152_9CRYT